MSKFEAEIILAMTYYSMRISLVAEKLYCHKNTVKYRIKKIKKETGLDARNFYDLIELLSIARTVLGDDYEL